MNPTRDEIHQAQKTRRIITNLGIFNLFIAHPIAHESMITIVYEKKHDFIYLARHCRFGGELES